MSDLTKLRKQWARAHGQVSRYERELEDLRDQYREAGQDQRPELTRRGQSLHLLLDAAKQDLEAYRARLAAEEQRLLQPGSFLRFT